MTLFFTTQLKCHQHTERTKGSVEHKSRSFPSPQKIIGPAGQKKGNLLHVSSKYAPQIQKICVRHLGPTAVILCHSNNLQTVDLAVTTTELTKKQNPANFLAPMATD